MRAKMVGGVNSASLPESAASAVSDSVTMPRFLSLLLADAKIFFYSLKLYGSDFVMSHHFPF